MVGLFINTVPQRIAVAPEQVLVAWLQSLQAAALAQQPLESCATGQLPPSSEVPATQRPDHSRLVFDLCHRGGNAVLASRLSTLLCTLGVGGPVFYMYYLARDLDRQHALRAPLAADLDRPNSPHATAEALAESFLATGRRVQPAGRYYLGRPSHRPTPATAAQGAGASVQTCADVLTQTLLPPSRGSSARLRRTPIARNREPTPPIFIKGCMKTPTCPHRSGSLPPIVSARGPRYRRIVDKNAPKAIGYIRVSTELQAADGISLDAQRESIEDYCHAHKLNLIAIYQDDHTGKTLHRKGFQAAIDHMKRSGAMLVGVKLDRITRNVGDLDYLLKTYFGDGKAFALRLVQFPVDTSSSIGRLILNIICSVAQWEREEICSRTQMGLNYLKKMGVYLGGAPYGKQYSEEPDAYGRRVLIDEPTELATISRICDLFDGGQSLHKIVKVLTEEGHQPRGKGRWSRIAAARILHRAGRVTCQPWDRSQAVRDKAVVGKRILELRADGLNLSEIGRQLTSENLMPARGNKWYAATVHTYLKERASYDQEAIAKLALSLREQKRTLSEIGTELTLRGYTPPRGGRWYPAQIKAILDLQPVAARAGKGL